MHFQLVLESIKIIGGTGDALHRPSKSISCVCLFLFWDHSCGDVDL